MNFFTMIVSLLSAVPRILSYVTTCIGYLPAFVAVPIGVSIGFAVIVTIINHWGE